MRDFPDLIQIPILMIPEGKPFFMEGLCAFLSFPWAIAGDWSTRTVSFGKDMSVFFDVEPSVPGVGGLLSLCPWSGADSAASLLAPQFRWVSIRRFLPSSPCQG